MKNHREDYRLANYIFGFAFSLILTLLAYAIAVNHALNGTNFLLSVGCLAFLQFLVQARYFLHIGNEAKPRWKLIVFMFMSLVVLIIVFGSIWIMNNLAYHHPDPAKSSDTYIIRDERVQQ